MTTAISNKSLLDKCTRFIIQDTSRGDYQLLIQDAIITASREIADLGHAKPLAWLREKYNEIFTRYYAQISDITSADPGVITAETVDPDLSDATGFSTNDIVYIEGVNGENSLHRLNNRVFRWEAITAATGKLLTMDGQDYIDTSSYEDYSSGGIIYHAGIILPTTIEPTGGEAAAVPFEWNIKRVYDIEIDGYPAFPITEDDARAQRLNTPGARPSNWRYQQYTYSNFSTVSHILFWYPYVSQRYNINALIEKEYPDISLWTSSSYPPHPPHIHDFIWHRALSNLATHGEKQRRRSAGKEGEFGDNTKIEVLNANYWIAKARSDEQKILEYSRMLEGDQPYRSKGMSA
jgi:hypothetical protein